MLVATWNMQGANTGGESIWTNAVASLFLKEKRDVVLLQECGAAPDPKNMETIPRRAWIGRVPTGTFEVNYGIWKIASTAAHMGIYIMHVNWDSRCNLAVLSVKKPSGFCYINNPKDDDGRPGIGIVLDDKEMFVSVHGFSGSGNDTSDFVNNTGLQAASVRAQWFCGGDYNCDPNLLKAKIAGSFYKPSVWYSGQVTRPKSGNELDYGVSSRPMAAGACTLSTITDKSDHIPVFFDYK